MRSPFRLLPFLFSALTFAALGFAAAPAAAVVTPGNSISRLALFQQLHVVYPGTIYQHPTDLKHYFSKPALGDVFPAPRPATRMSGHLVAASCALPRPSSITGLKYNQVCYEFWNAVHDVLTERATPDASLGALETKLQRISRHGRW